MIKKRGVNLNRRQGLQLKNRKILIALSCLLSAQLCQFIESSARAAGSDQSELQSQTYVSSGNQLQQFSTNISLSEKDSSKPLTFTFYNGPSNSPKFSWVRVFLSSQAGRSAGRVGSPGQPTGRLIVSEASFAGGKNEVTLNMTGIIKPGSALTINGAGYKGAAIGWRLTTTSAGESGGASSASTLQITSVAPVIARGGGSLTISGAGFAIKPSENTVLFNKKSATVAQASATSLTVEVPPTITAGKCLLQVLAKGNASNIYTIMAQGAPELTRTDWLAGQSGTTVTIYGKNFSTEASENHVFFGKERAPVLSATSDTLTVTVPFFPELDGALCYVNPTPFDLSLTVGTTPAKGHLTFYSSKVGWQ